MWFHLLSVAAFLALGSCQIYQSYQRGDIALPTCQDLGCPCECQDGSCPPCVVPLDPACLKGCDSHNCPCMHPIENHRSDVSGRHNPSQSTELPALALSTVILNPVGPICTAVNVKQTLLMTVDTCVAGKPLADLYVTLNSPRIESLKVKEILAYPRVTSYPRPALLVVNKPKLQTSFLEIPLRPLDAGKNGEMQKWKVSKTGLTYSPKRIPVKSYETCTGKDKVKLVCVTTYNTTTMGWNDLGSVFVELSDNKQVVHGLYYGEDLYRPTHSLKYLSVHENSLWLTENMKDYA